MRNVVAVLGVVAIGLLAFPTAPVSQAATSQGFAEELSVNPVPIVDPCYRVCKDNDGVKSCGVSLTGIRGCSKIVNNNCIYVICPPDGGGDPE